MEGATTTKRATKAKIGSKSQKITVVSFTMLFFVMCARAASWSYSSQGFTSCICFDNGSSAMAVANNFVIESAGERRDFSSWKGDHPKSVSPKGSIFINMEKED
jgi:hypothetical protein